MLADRPVHLNDWLPIVTARFRDKAINRFPSNKSLGLDNAAGQPKAAYWSTVLILRLNSQLATTEIGTEKIAVTMAFF